MRLRCLITLLSLTALFAGCSTGGHKFVIIGNITGMPMQSILLEQLGANDIISVIDSTQSDKDGHFEFTEMTPEPGLFRLHFKSHKFVLLSIDHENVKVIADWSNIEKYNTTGSPASENLKQLIVAYRDQMRDFHTMSIVLDTLKAKGSDSMLAVARKDMEDMNQKFTRFIENYADTTQYLPNAVFAARILNPSSEIVFLDQFSQRISQKYKNSRMAKDFAEYYLKVSSKPVKQATVRADVSVGQLAPDVDLPNVEGDKIALATLRGKYVLIDFWASFCPPCREENPNIVAVYKKYHPKNFDIYGISLDDNKTDWYKAVKEDKLEWPQVCDLKRWESPVAKLYGVEAIPTNFLIDPTGHIVARDLRGDRLEAFLKTVLK